MGIFELSLMLMTICLVGAAVIIWFAFLSTADDVERGMGDE